MAGVLAMLTHTVRVWTPKEAGTDEMGDPVLSWTASDHPGVLVRVLSRSDATDADLHAMGEGVQFALAFPKGDTARLGGCRVALTDAPWSMDGTDPDKALRVIHDQDPQSPCPTRWNRIVQAGRFDG